MTGIYIIKNKLNNKVYIGQAVDINARFYDHKKGYGISHNSAIDIAIQKYGENNFLFEILKKCSKDELNYWEAYYAEQYNSYTPNGYNIATCGEHGYNHAWDKEVSCYDLITGQLIQTYPSIREAERRTGYARSGISSAASGKGPVRTVDNMYWAWGHEPQIKITKPKGGPNGGKTVYYYDLNTGNYLGEFYSLSKAEVFLGIKGVNKNISSVCLGKRNYAYGYIWSYEQYNNIKEKN